MICCGQWGVNATGYFGGQNMSNLADVQALGLGVQPLGSVSNLALMSRSWKDTDAVAKAVEWTQEYNLSGIVVDNEAAQSNCTCTSHTVCHCTGGWGQNITGDLPVRRANLLAQDVLSAAAKNALRAGAVHGVHAGDAGGPGEGREAFRRRHLQPLGRRHRRCAPIPI